MAKFIEGTVSTMKRLTGGQHSALEIALVVMLVVSFVSTMYAWTFLAIEAARIPLILFGTLVIAVLVLFTRKGAVLAISILIIGTVVTHEDFIVKLAFMFGEGKGRLEDYLERRPGQAHMLPESTNIIVDQASREFMPKLRTLVTQSVELVVPQVAAAGNGVPAAGEETRLFIAEVVRDLERPVRKELEYMIGTIAFRIKARESLERHAHLYRVVKGLTDFQQLAALYGSLERFNFDMAALKNEDLIDCKENDWASCVPTDYAARVIAKMER